MVMFSHFLWREHNYSYFLNIILKITGLQRNWGKHKNTRFYLIECAEFKFEIRFLLITCRFLDIHSVHFVHIRYIKAYMNSGLILILWDLWLIF